MMNIPNFNRRTLTGRGYTLSHTLPTYVHTSLPYILTRLCLFISTAHYLTGTRCLALRIHSPTHSHSTESTVLYQHTHTHPSRSSVSALVLAFQLCVGVCKQNPEFPTRQRTRSDPISVRLFQGQPLAPFLHNSTLHCLALATLALRREPSY